MKHIKHEKSATRSKLQPTSWLKASTTAKRSLPTTVRNCTYDPACKDSLTIEENKKILDPDDYNAYGALVKKFPSAAVILTPTAIL